VVRVGRDAGQDVAEVVEGVHLVSVAGGDDGEPGRGDAASVVAGEEHPVLAFMRSSA